MAIDVLTIILTAVCTGIGISIGNGLYEIYFKDPLKKLKKQNDRLKKIHQKLKDYKRPWLAALINVFLWGAGYFYLKKKRMLGIILLLIQLFVVGGFIFSQNSWQNLFEGATYSFLIIIISASLGVDAYRTAREINSEKKVLTLK